MSQINEMKFGIEIYSEGYNGGVRVYQNTKDISDLYRDEIKYINQRIATIVSRYREMYRYQIMMSSTYGGGWRVEFDVNQIRDIGFDGIDLVYSDLESLSIQFSEELNGVIDTVLDAYVYSRTCNDVCGVLSQYVDDSDRAYWVELLDKVVNCITDILGRFYVYYVGLLTNRDVIEYMLQRYNNGYVVGQYHNELATGILHVTIDLGIFRIRDIDVDAVYGFTVENGVVDFNPTNALFNLEYITGDIVVDFCNVLEMMAYVHDAVIGYYVSNGVSLYRGYVLVSQVLDNLQLGADSYTCMADSFTDVIGSIELGDYFEYQDCVFSYDDNLESIDMYIPIREFNTKVMASRVFDVGKLMRSYVNMVEEYSKGIYSIS